MNKYIIYSYLTLAIASTGCSKTNTIYSDATKVIGHGGMGIVHDYPMNTFEAIAFALNKGTDGVEIDVQMTADSVLVAYHHERLEEDMKIKGSIFEKSWSKIRNEVYKELIFSDYGLVSLDDIFTHIPEYKDRIFFFDIKTFTSDTTGAYEERLVRQLITVIDKYELTNTIVEVKSEHTGLLFKRQLPEQVVFLYKNFEEAIDSCVKYDFQGITRDIDQLSLDKVERAHSKGLKIACINTHSKQRNDNAFQIGVDYNQTDMVNYVLRKTK